MQLASQKIENFQHFQLMTELNIIINTKYYFFYQPSFDTAWKSAIRTAVMMIGEFDYTDTMIDADVL